MSKEYSFGKIEKKWQDFWVNEKIFEAKIKGKKYYSLTEFPYPSADGLHVGHLRSYTAIDIVARKKRMQGYDVLFPIGFDAFGLPTENYAIKVKRNPKDITEENIKTFTRQLKAMGLSFDWDRQVNTSDPNYYRWTQWIFLKLFKAGLVYQKEMPINWCPSCKTGLANEEVVAGKCERCGAEATKKNQKQWLFKITQYADRLIGDLDKVDFLDKIKKQQIDWIGKSEGAEIKFQITSNKSQTNHKSQISNSKLLIGTKNSAKKKRYTDFLEEMELNVMGLEDLKKIGLEIEEGKDIKENALKKARIYFKATKIPTIAVDEAFYIDKLSDSKQPGSQVRRIPGSKNERPTDNELISYYKKELKKIEGEGGAHWEFAVAFVDGKTEKVKIFEASFSKIVAKPSQVIKKGYPLDSFQIDLMTNKYRSELTEEEEKEALAGYGEEVKEFIRDAIGYEDTGKVLEVFTTRPDTLFGATYMVLSPEHELIHKLEGKIKNISEVKEYIEKAARKSDLERTESKEKTGVELKGIKAVNPANKKEIPIFVADYVLVSYGTGAIMAVPGHDERDFEFAKKYNLPVEIVIEPETGEKRKNEEKRKRIVAIVHDKNNNKFLLLDWGKKYGGHLFVGGGIEEGEDAAAAAMREVEEETGYYSLKPINTSEKVHHHYIAFNKGKNRNSETIGVYLELTGNEKKKPVLSAVEKGKFTTHWLTAQEAEKNITDAMHHYFFDKFIKGTCYTGEGLAVNSGEYDGLTTDEFKKKITNWLEKNNHGKAAVNYKLRDWIFSRQHYWGEPIPLVICEKCGVQPVPEKDLPVTLPEIEEYEPTDTGQSPLAKISDWVNVKCPKCQGKAKRETDTMPNWAGSNWYFIRYADPHNDKEFASKKSMKHWLPVDLYNGGMEHTTLHLLYSRFWYKALYDLKLVPGPEPYKKRVSHGMVLAEDSRKMSKSSNNVVNPDEIISEYGADAVRLYEMFMGPFDQAISWSTDGLRGMKRFLDKVYKLFEARKEGKVENILHKTIKKVTEDIEAMRFNTAVSQLMILTNEMLKKGTNNKTLEKFLIILSPFAPHIAEELWSRPGRKTSIFEEKWPTFDSALIKEKEIEFVIQINGKVRDRLNLPADISEKEAKEKAFHSEKVKKFLKGEPKKVIFVKGKLINFVF